MPVPLFRRDKLSPQAKQVADSFKMVNSSPEFDDSQAESYMDRNRDHFAADVRDIMARLHTPRS